MSDLGVIFPIPPAYTEGGEALDLKSTSKYIESLVEAGVRTVMTTVGTSQYNLLSYSEILDFNIHVCRIARHYGLHAIIGVPPLPNIKVESFTRYFTGMEGIHALMVMWPDRFSSLRNMTDWLLSLRGAVDGTPLWLHARPVRRSTSGTHVFSVGDLDDLYAYADLAGVKEESMDSLNLPYEISRLARPDFTVCLAGGSMRRAAVASPDKHVTWLAGIGSFFPEAEIAARKGWLHGYDALFRHVQQDIEDPAFVCASRIGWHVFMRATMAHLGLLPKHQRAPFSLDATAMRIAQKYVFHAKEVINEASLDTRALHG